MFNILNQTGIFFLYITIAYIFKKIKLLKKEDANVLAKIIMNLTLPCVFFSSSSKLEINSDFILFMLLGLVVNIIMIVISYLVNYHQDPLSKGTYMIACSGYDVGNFILPFVSVFFSGLGVMYLCSFNITNTIMAMGITYALACSLLHQQTHFELKVFIKELLSSVSFDVYILIIIIACFHLTIPSSLLKITSTIASSNSLLVMMMIGLKLEFNFSKKETKQLFKILSIRFFGAIFLSLLTFVLPITLLAKQIFTITYFGPLVSVASIYAKKLGYQGGVVASSNTISIIISMLMTTILLTIFR